MTGRSRSKSIFQPGDKVICVDDSYLRPDLAECPHGVPNRGIVYSVTGVSQCGGILLEGLSAISRASGREVGFDPARFLTPQDFATRYPGGIFEIPRLDEEYYGVESDKRPPEYCFPEIPELMLPRTTVRQAIDRMSEIFEELAAQEEAEEVEILHWHPDQTAGAIRNELLGLLQSPDRFCLVNESWIFWNRLIRDNVRTLLVCRALSPLAGVFFHLSTYGKILTQELVQGELSESVFPCLTVAAGTMARAQIRICDGRQGKDFLDVLARVHSSFQVVVCDWMLDGEELAEAYRVTRDSPVAFLRPFGATERMIDFEKSICG